MLDKTPQCLVGDLEMPAPTQVFSHSSSPSHISLVIGQSGHSNTLNALLFTLLYVAVLWPVPTAVVCSLQSLNDPIVYDILFLAVSEIAQGLEREQMEQGDKSWS